ncbi:MAG: cytochrome c biogenesis protein CcdA [Candidatus Zixiibacteriota bacterium]|nr:MAG: cytochrome c biogenesis protein CcdA [candidate division Zixibacteria bacterium]
MESLVSQIQQGSPLTVLAVFLGGLLSAASPCVLALIPLVIGYVGGYAGESRRKALLFTTLFVVGLCVTFTVLGSLAGLLGQMMGPTGRWWYFIIAGLAVAMGLSLLGVYDMNFLGGRMAGFKKTGIWGALVLGMLFGVVSSPCATPVLVVILGLVSLKGNILYATFLLFIYALGHSALIFAAGTVTGFAESFISSKATANFSIWSKRVSGILIILAGLYLFYLNV